MFVESDSKFFGQPSGLLRRLQADRQNNHIDIVPAHSLCVAGVLYCQTFRTVFFIYIAYPRPDELHAILALCPLIILIEILAECPHVHEEDG